MLKGFKRTILYGGYLLLVTLSLLEIAVRMWGYSERYIYDPIYTSFEPSEAIPYVHKPNLVDARARGLALINTDSLGLRSLTSGTVYGTKQSSEYRIAIAGDSFTFGEGITNTKDTFSQVLENRLNQQQSFLTVKVFNFGVSAYSVKQMVATLQYRMVDIKPDLVVMAIIPGDFDVARTPILDTTGYLIDQRISIFLDPWLGEIVRRIHLLYPIKDITFHWFFQSKNGFSTLSRSVIPESYRYIRQFKEMADQLGLPYVILLIPIGENAWGPLPERLRSEGITHLDLSPLNKEFTSEQYKASQFDSHASAAVHHRIGELLADYVRHLPAFSLDLPPSN